MFNANVTYGLQHMIARSIEVGILSNRSSHTHASLCWRLYKLDCTFQIAALCSLNLHRKEGVKGRELRSINVMSEMKLFYIAAKPVGITLTCTGALTRGCRPLLALIAIITLNA